MMLNAIEERAGTAIEKSATGINNTQDEGSLAALRFITCGSVDDGKSTLIGRLLVDSRSVLQDQLAGVQRSGETDLALLTDGLSAEREQGITIDVAYRYFATARRKFIIGDAPGHEQYTRNMVTAASSADAAVVLVDATKLGWAVGTKPGADASTSGAADANQQRLLPQTRRHALLAHLLRVPSVLFAVNKLDAVPDAAVTFARIREALLQFAQSAGFEAAAIVPVSALKGWNVVQAEPGWAGYMGPSLLDVLEALPVTTQEHDASFALPVQWVEKTDSSSAVTSQGRRVFWGRVASGTLRPGQSVSVLPGGQEAVVAQALDHARRPGEVPAGRSGGIVLDREIDVSRGDWLVASGSIVPSRTLNATVAWLDDEPMVQGRTYWALHGHRWVKARVSRIVDRLDIETLARGAADSLPANALGTVELALQEPLATLPFSQSRALGSLILVDTATHRTAAAVLVQ
jgi:sulfate adenylyltransferase subunit 1